MMQSLGLPINERYRRPRRNPGIATRSIMCSCVCQWSCSVSCPSCTSYQAINPPLPKVVIAMPPPLSHCHLCRVTGRHEPTRHLACWPAQGVPAENTAGDLDRHAGLTVRLGLPPSEFAPILIL